MVLLPARILVLLFQIQAPQVFRFHHAKPIQVLQEQALQRNFAESLSIFLLKNARGQGYTDKPTEELTTRIYHELPSERELVEQMDLIFKGSDTEGLI